MNENEWLVERFEANRTHLQGVAYRMLGSLSAADDVVQDAWLRFSRVDTSSVDNLTGWLTTVVARLCLDQLRAQKSRREDSLDGGGFEPVLSGENGSDPEHEAILADSVGLALLVVLETLNPAERLAFVLHDMFAVSFDEIAPLVGRTPTAARQLASRARRRVQGAKRVDGADHSHQRQVVSAFVAASRGGDFDALLAVLDPDVLLRVDSFSVPEGTPLEARGAVIVSQRATKGNLGAAQLALVNGTVGIVVAPRGRLIRVLCFKIMGEKIVEVEVIADPKRLRQLDLAVLTD